MSEPDIVFVYGSLMRGLELHHYMDGGTFVGEGRASGVLVSLGRFPGMIDGSGTVRGELYRFVDLPAILDVLDDIEEFDATDPAKSVYVRVVRPVRYSDGNEVAAWLYLYNRSVNGCPRIKDGNWRKWPR